jgi:hypothetical protein
MGHVLVTDPACRIYESLLSEHGGDANAALMALAARYAAIAAGVSLGFLRRPVRPHDDGAPSGTQGGRPRREPLATSR